jgi:2-amino-4-hydroxy-6-hydroxymethyldihydropteridine diphosphokinase
MNKVYLLIGGNMGDRMANLINANKHIEQEIGNIKLKSSIYETAAWGQTNQPDFLNQALLVHTRLEAAELMSKLLSIENLMGRIRTIKLGPRTIDLDIIYFNNDVISTSLITIPHPKLAERKFVLAPLFEIAPDYLHPILNKTNASMLKECGDPLAVYKKTNI